MIGQSAPTGPVDRLAGDLADMRKRIAELERSRIVIPRWIAPTFLNGWTNYGAGFQDAQYRKVGDDVQVRGLIKDGTIGVSAFDLPAGFRPPARLIFAVDTATNAHARVDVGTSGQVFIISGSATYVSINLRFSTTP